MAAFLLIKECGFDRSFMQLGMGKRRQFHCVSLMPEVRVRFHLKMTVLCNSYSGFVCHYAVAIYCSRRSMLRL